MQPTLMKLATSELRWYLAQSRPAALIASSISSLRKVGDREAQQ